VTSADDGEQHVLDDVLLTDDELADLRADAFEGFLEMLGGCFWGHKGKGMVMRGAVDE
jgi:hypothetical protein